MERDEIQRRFGHLLPKYPSADAVPVTTLPEPPLLRADETDAVGVLLRAHNTACVEWFARRGVKLENVDDALVEKLSAAAKILREERISPVAWAGFSCSIWAGYKSAKGRKKDCRAPPPVAWVFSEKRLRERRDWFTWREASFSGGRVFIEPEHVELDARYQRIDYAMRLADAAGELDEARVKAIVAKHLQKRVYAALVDVLEDKALARTRELRLAVRRGEWVWS